MSSSEDFVVQNGVLLKYTGEDTDVLIPENVECIGKEAFYFRAGVKTVVIPDGVTSVSERAFYDCIELTSVKIAGSVISIGDEAFASCHYLKNVELKEGLKIIGKEAFNWTGLKEIILPNSVVEIGKDFVGESTSIITDISDIKIFPPAYRPKMIVDYASGQYDSSDSRNESYQKYIKANAGKLVKLAVENPEVLALMCHEKLITPKNAELYMKAVQESGNIESIALMLEYMGGIEPKKKKQLRDNEEKQQEKIIEKKISHGEKTGIKGLVFVVSGKLQTFTNRDALKLYITENGGKLISAISANVDCLITNEGTNSSKFKKAEELGIEIISEQQFNKMAERKYWIEDHILMRYLGDEEEVTIPEGVNCIEHEAFYKCNSIKLVNIPEGVLKICTQAFSGCCKLEDVSIPDSIEEISDLCVFENTPWLEAQPKGIISAGHTVIGYTGKETTLCIPEGTKIIGNYAFSNNKILTKVILPTSVKRIGDWAFNNCDNLESINLPNGVEYLGNWSFSNCTKLSEIIIPNSIKNLTDNPFCSGFSDCINISTIELLEGLDSIGGFMFRGCKSLTKIIIPDGVKQIGAFAFSECRNLTSVTIPTSVKEIGDSAFDKCKKLTIYTYMDSYAEQYAKNNNIPFKYIKSK